MYRLKTLVRSADETNSPSVAAVATVATGVSEKAVQKSESNPPATPATVATNDPEAGNREHTLPCYTATPATNRAQRTERRRLILAARDAAGLDDYRAALVRGQLHLCGNCTRFSFGADDPAGLGQCAHFNVEAWPFVPMLRCAGFDARSAAIAPAPDYLPAKPAGEASERTLPARCESP
jgi:hypothetical protein